MDFLLALLWLAIAVCGFAQKNGVGLAVGSAAGLMAVFRASRWWLSPPAGPAAATPAGPTPPVRHSEFDFTNREPEATNQTP